MSPITNNDVNLGVEGMDIEATLAPYVAERFPIDDPGWLDEIRILSRRWRRRLWRRRLLGWLPGNNVPRIFRGRRTQDYVRSSYDATWGSRTWPETHSPVVRNKLIRAVWCKEGLLVRQGGLPRVHLLCIAQVLSGLQPRSVLEVGSGDGLNVFVLASKFPEIEWSGIELTKNGVARSQAIQQEAVIPDPLVQYCPWPVVDRTAYQKISFQQGDSTKLPFPDESFDLVVTRQALEQMDMVRDAALTEMARVARRYVLMVEPFADFNQDSLRQSYLRAKDYFSLPVDQLNRFGINPISVFHDFPQNITLGLGFVLGEVSRNSSA